MHYKVLTIPNGCRQVLWNETTFQLHITTSRPKNAFTRKISSYSNLPNLPWTWTYLLVPEKRTISTESPPPKKLMFFTYQNHWAIPPRKGKLFTCSLFQRVSMSFKGGFYLELLVLRLHGLTGAVFGAPNEGLLRFHHRKKLRLKWIG